jgi:hypothetical protein
MHPDNAPLLVGMLSAGAFALLLGTILGWMARSIFIAREIERVSREAWRQARLITEHKGKL